MFKVYSLSIPLPPTLYAGFPDSLFNYNGCAMYGKVRVLFLVSIMVFCSEEGRGISILCL